MQPPLKRCPPAARSHHCIFVTANFVVLSCTVLSWFIVANYNTLVSCVTAGWNLQEI